MSEWSELALVGTSIALVVATVVLARFTGRLWKANERLAATNERLAKIEEDRERAAQIRDDEVTLRRLSVSPTSLQVPGAFPTLRRHIPSLLDREGSGSLNGELNLYGDDASKLPQSLLDYIASTAARKLQDIRLKK